MPATKRNTYRLYLNDEDTALMQKIAEAVEMGQSELMSKLMSAALRGVAANNNRFSLPLRLNVAGAGEVDYSRLNESPEKARSRR